MVLSARYLRLMCYQNEMFQRYPGYGKICPVMSRPTGPAGGEWNDSAFDVQCDLSKCPCKRCPDHFVDALGAI